MADLTIEELALGERKFLHDIANHLVVAQGMSSFVMKAVKENRPLEEKDIERLQKTIDAIKKMTEQLKERRAILHTVS
jgi:cob(I)alamin adenosyltransferase